MTYLPNEPKDLPPPVVATTQMRTNFAQFQTVFSNNHSALNTSNQGKHEKVIFEQQSDDPGITSNYIAMYAKSVTNNINTQPQGFIQIPKFLPNDQPNLAEQITYNTVNTAGPIYQTFLPGGYVLYFGVVNVVPITITLLPACNGIATVVVNANNTDIFDAFTFPFDVYAEVANPNQFTIKSNTAHGTYTFTWTAIGFQ